MDNKKCVGMDECKVSVIVPVYNVEAYLEECVESLLGQTLDDIEILLIDDGSTDLSGSMCDKYAKKYSNVSVFHKKNAGQGAARNLGLTMIKGKYVYYMDSDDLLELDALRILYDEAERNNLEVILFSAECFSGSQEIKFDSNQYRRTKYLYEVKTGEELFANLYNAREYYCSIPMRFFNRKYLMENKFVFPEHIIHEDEIFGFLSLIKANRAECVPYQFYKRRFREGSTMTSKKAYNSAIGYLETWRLILEFKISSKTDVEEIYGKFSTEFLRMAVNLYDSFEKQDEKAFRRVRRLLKQFIYSKSIRIDKKYRVFLISPFLYKQYKIFSNIRKGILKTDYI